jgi:hypothetical protein
MNTPQYFGADEFDRLRLLDALEPLGAELRRVPFARRVGEYTTTLGGLLLSLPVDARRQVVKNLDLLTAHDLH